MSTEETFNHIPVLSSELLRGMAFAPAQVIVDCTVGGGGHLGQVISATNQDAKYIAFDRDPQAIKYVSAKFDGLISSTKLTLHNRRFSELTLAADLAKEVDRIYADIGVSSVQLDLADRGFSFLRNGPLDMRMDPRSGTTAADIVNNSSADELISILRTFGEEPRAAFFVRKIIERRQVTPFFTTSDLANFISEISPYSHSRKHPATRIFQALRIQVNCELDELQSFLKQSFEILKVGGRLGVITFHSLEDRIVKNFFQQLTAVQLPRGIPITEQQIAEMGLGSSAKLVKPYPAEPSESEIEKNPRSRSAKLRIIEKIKGASS